MDTREIEYNLAQEYRYKKLPSDLSYRMRLVYRYNLPEFLSITGSTDQLYSTDGTLICNGYNRIVIGDYGAFIEFDKSQAGNNFIIKSGQEYRVFDPNYKDNVKYYWYTTTDHSNVKIYYQIRRVTYADYTPGMYYVSPHEVIRRISNMNKILFTHIDLDGYGARIMVQRCFPDISVKHVDYGFDILPENRKLMAENDMIIFTDISISRETAELLEMTRQTGKKLLLLDHHQSAYDNLNDLGYEWIKIDQSKSGALLAYEYFNPIYPDKLLGYENLAEYISDYDLWHHNYPESKMLQFLWSSNSDYFTDRFMSNPEVNFNEFEMGIISESMKNLEDSYNEAINSMSKHTDCDGLTFGLIKSIGLLSSLAADRIMKENPDIVYLVIMNKKGSLSLRSLHYEVRKIAEALGGGGHPLASGVPIPQDKVVDILESVKNRNWRYFSLNLGS